MMKECQQRMREAIKEELAKKEMRVWCIGNKVKSLKWTEEHLAILESLALELRSLAYQIRNLKMAKLALETAMESED
ncbi:MAG: hypothetical protein ACI4RA_10805 [Kiritimatiellia bacterium]